MGSMTDGENISLKLVTSIKECSKMTSHMAKENTLLQMATSMKDSSKMVFKTAKENTPF